MLDRLSFAGTPSRARRSVNSHARAIPERIEVSAGAMIAAIHFDDQPHAGPTEVGDVSAEHELTPERGPDRAHPKRSPASFWS